MTIEQVAEMIAKADEKMNGIAGKLHDFINACPLYTEESRKTCHDIVADSLYSKQSNPCFIRACLSSFNLGSREEQDEQKKELASIDIETMAKTSSMLDYYETLVDGEPMEFHGDIVITDPCFFLQSGNWKESCYGSNLGAVGIPNAISRDTLAGDWFCTVVSVNDEGTQTKIGTFFADAGMVAVASLDEVLACNPAYAKDLKEKKWQATILKNFHGTFQFVVKDVSYIYDGDDTEYFKKGEYIEEYALELIGNGEYVSEDGWKKPCYIRGFQEAM